MGNCSNERSAFYGRRSRRGEGPKGLISRMLHLRKASRHDAKLRGGEPIKDSAEDMLRQWYLQHGKCAACNGPLELLEAAYDHCHETGKGRGFTHRVCNQIEGFMRGMSPGEIKAFVKWVLKLRS